MLTYNKNLLSIITLKNTTFIIIIIIIICKKV